MNTQFKGQRTKRIVWKNVVLLSTVHLLACLSCYSFLAAKWLTITVCYTFTLLASLLGITAGAHRLWSHRSYKATTCLRIFLMLCNTLALQNDIYVWCRDHRVHHRYSETDADPHNSNRGFFFSHIGWLLCRKHEDVRIKGSKVDLSDLERDQIVMFQRRFYKPIVFLFWFFLPTFLPVLLWNENPIHSFLICVCARYVVSLHVTWLVNSAAHLYGSRPYDRRIEPRENNLVIYFTLGEGYHNYHHTFPWDYSTSEFNWLANFNFTTLAIDLFAFLRLASDLKTVPPEMIQKRISRTGNQLCPTVTSQIIGFTIGTMCIWLPILTRIVINTAL